MTRYQRLKRPLVGAVGENDTESHTAPVVPAACARAGETAAATAMAFAELIAGSRESIRLHTGGNTYHDSVPWSTVEPDRPWIEPERPPGGIALEMELLQIRAS